MDLWDMRRAIRDATETINNADDVVTEMVRIITGRLQSGKVPSYLLRELKNELRGYNSNTKSWKERR